MTSVLLVSPRGTHKTKVQPLGLLYLAACLQLRGVEVDVLDIYEEPDESRVEQQFKSHGLYDFVGVGMMTELRHNALKVLRLAKQWFGGKVRTVAGGPHPTFMWHQLLSNYPELDYCWIGESEATFTAFVCDGIKSGCAFRDAYGTPVIVQAAMPAFDLDSLPFPAWSRQIGWTPTGFLVSSRGCRSGCTFCAVPRFWHGWRARSGKLVAEEMGLLASTYHIREFVFMDDTMGIHQTPIRELCAAITGKGYHWHTTCRTNDVMPDMLELMRDAGCFEIAYGVESGSPKILKSINKKADLAVAAQALQWTMALGIKATALVMVGNIGETKETINETIDFLQRIDPDKRLNLGSLDGGVWILPGTQMHRQCVASGYFSEDYWLTDGPLPMYFKEHSKARLQEFIQAIVARRRLK